jgi:hypothetical protein
MKIATSRYGNPAVKDAELRKFGFTNGDPHKLDYEMAMNLRLLAPPRYSLKLEQWETIYRAHLDRLGVERIRALLELSLEMSNQGRKHPRDGVVLLCFEDVRDPAHPCHRTVFAAWWKEQTGEDVEELADPTDDPTSLDLLGPMQATLDLKVEAAAR